MAAESHRNNVRIGIFLLIAFSHIFSNKFVFVDGIKGSDSLIKNYTIQADNGDVIDCVDIYKQPAFSHPLLKNHTLQKRPSSSPGGFIKGNKDLFQGWKMNLKCPKGTIPIAITKLFKYPKTTLVFRNRTHPNGNSAANDAPHEYAQASMERGPYYGVHANLNVWNPSTFNDEFSLSQIWVAGGDDNPDLNTIEAGWHIFEGNKEPRFFIYWTRDHYRETGCFNLNCPGFVQINPVYCIGAEINPVSIYNGQQYYIDLTVHKDRQSGNWWLRLNGEELGYWPGSIFTSLAESSNLITWGGEIVNSGLNGHHTSTQMGSGHFPSEGYGKAAYIGNLGYIDKSGAMRDPKGLYSFVTKSSCYDLKFGKKGKQGLGAHFYFGGPGFSAQCQ